MRNVGANLLDSFIVEIAFTVVSHPDDGDFGLETGVGDVIVDLPGAHDDGAAALGLVGIAALRRRD